MAEVTVGNALSTGWSMFKHNVGFLILVTFIVVLVDGVIFWVMNSFDSVTMRFVFQIVYLVVASLLAAGVIHIYLDLLDGKKGTVGELFTHTNQLLPLIIVNLVIGVAIAVGTILLIIPGIVVGVLLMFGQYLVVDKKMKPMDALKHSIQITKGHFWLLLGFVIVTILLNGVGALVLGVGLFVTMPITAGAFTYLYRQLASGHATAPVTSSTPSTPQA